MLCQLLSLAAAVAADLVLARGACLAGAGDGFCSGADIKLLTQGLDEYSISDQTRTSDIVLKIRNAPQVFIAAVHGAAAGAGMCFALACDVRLASQTMRMNCAFLFLGLGGAELGASFFLPRMVGSSLASEMMLTGRFVHAQRALATGLVSAVFETKDELYAAAEAMALEMLAAAPRALLMTKQAIVLNSEGVSLESAIRTEDRAQVCCIKDPECMRVGMKYALRFASKL